MTIPPLRDEPRTQGSVMIAALIFAVILSGFALSTLAVVSRGHQAQQQRELQERRLFLAEAALDAALAELSEGLDGEVGSARQPVAMGAGAFYATTTPAGPRLLRVRGVGVVKGETRMVQATVRQQLNPFAAAIFAGNSSEDPNYRLDFGGVGSLRDDITGDVFSGGDLHVQDEAEIDGQLYARGNIDGATGTDGFDPPNFDIEGMNYEVNHDIDVAGQFAAHESYTLDDAGGTAWQVPEEIPAHIFRKNPSDRLTEVLGTVKDDYFLEDPYETVRRDASWDGSDAYEITLSGTGDEPGPDSNDMVYFVDGNFWIHNIPTYSMKFVHPDGEPLRVTFVVKGNIYIGDNLFYGNPEIDGVALIAIEDERVADSGNIYFGDPRAGTLETMYGLMYAQNDFYDNNLNKSGAARIIVNGSMSAGNHVAIERDFATQRSQLVLTHDTRLAEGLLELAGIPGQGAGDGALEVLLWELWESSEP